MAAKSHQFYDVTFFINPYKEEVTTDVTFQASLVIAI